MNLNLILALMWLILSIVCFLYSLFHPEGAWLEIFRKRIPLTWVGSVALIVFGYNMVRWWLMRVLTREREVMKQVAGRTRRRVDEHNPEFDFSDETDKKDNVH